MGRLAMVVVIASASACYAPSPQAGSPCPDGRCPSGLSCSAVTQTCERTDAPIDATAADAASDGIPAGCYGTGLLTICPDAPITGQQHVLFSGMTTIDTATSPSCLAYTSPTPGVASDDLCLIAGRTLGITSTGRLAGTGPRPLVLLATKDIFISGVVDVASRRGGAIGAGADPSGCVSGELATGRSGGAGGSFGSAGGAGGRGDNGAEAAAAAATASITALRGGCRGGAGAGVVAGSSGRGGGAVYLIAADSILLDGTINASGAGGNGGSTDGGGGGGGSGGMIVLDAPNLLVAQAQLVANGGGGGEGAGANPGNGGADPSPSAPTTPAAGGKGGALGGGDGGDGFAGTTAAKAGGNNNAGGGGGGGAGVIKVFPPRALTGMISPAPG